ncbi:MAG: translation initiation factor IF-2 N-terminal domain-containing protein [Clostridia bacterium]|nr:translation initiation factor IF-2 N-terminal domain-containing protein [Clostridia bacterium]
MANNPQFKVMQLAKDLGLKSKDVVDLCQEKGMDIKTQKVLEPAEFDLLLTRLPNPVR